MADIPRSPEAGELARLLQKANAYAVSSSTAIAAADAVNDLATLLSALEVLADAAGGGVAGPMFDAISAIDADGSFATPLAAVGEALIALGELAGGVTA